MDLQHGFVRHRQQFGQRGAFQPGGQGGDGQPQVLRQAGLELGQQRAVGRQSRRGAVVVDLQAGQRDAGAAPGREQGGRARVDVGLAQGADATVEPQHQHDGTPGCRQRGQVGRCLEPGAVGAQFGRQHAPRAQHVGAVSQCVVQRGRPAPLPDVGIVGQGRGAAFAGCQQQQSAQNRQTPTAHRRAGDARPVRGRARAWQHDVRTVFEKAARGGCGGCVILSLTAPGVLALSCLGCQSMPR